MTMATRKASDIKRTAQAFVQEWQGRSKEWQDDKTFWEDLLEDVLDIPMSWKEIEVKRTRECLPVRAKQKRHKTFAEEIKKQKK